MDSRNVDAFVPDALAIYSFGVVFPARAGCHWLGVLTSHSLLLRAALYKKVLVFSVIFYLFIKLSFFRQRFLALSFFFSFSVLQSYTYSGVLLGNVR